MTQHTPGPWHTDRYVTGNGIAEHVSNMQGLIASVGDHDARCGGLHKMYASPNYLGHGRLEVMRANARLIATAPDLLEACKELLSIVVDEWEGPNSKCLMYSCQGTITPPEHSTACTIGRAVSSIARAGEAR